MMGNLVVKGSVAMVISVLIFANSAMALSPHSRHGFFNRNSEKKAEKMVEHLSDELDLDSVQISNLNLIKDEITAKQKELKVDKQQLFETMMAEIDKEKFDVSKFQVMVDNHAAKTKLETAFFAKKLVEFHQMLSPVQREAAVEKMKEMKQRREDRKNGWFYKTPEERADSIVNMISNRLDLSETQFADFTKIKNNFLKSRAKYFGDGYFLRLSDQFSEQFVRDTLNKDEIQHEMNEGISRMEKLMNVVLTNLEKAHHTLNNEQRAQIVEQMQKRQGRFSRK